MSYATPQAAQVLSEITRRVDLILDCAKHHQHESTLALIEQMAIYVKSASEALAKLQAAQSPAVAVHVTGQQMYEAYRLGAISQNREPCTWDELTSSAHMAWNAAALALATQQEGQAK